MYLFMQNHAGETSDHETLPGVKVVGDAEEEEEEGKEVGGRGEG